MKVFDMEAEDIIRRLTSDQDKTFLVNTTIEVISVDREIKEGSGWRLGYITAGNIKHKEEIKMEFQMNLWSSLSLLVNKLEKGDVLNIKKGLAKYYNGSPQINCDGER